MVELERLINKAAPRSKPRGIWLNFNINKIHTTELGMVRIKKNLGLETDDVVGWCKKKIKLELILAQLRHIFYHIGYLHCCIKMEKGETPEYIGLYNAMPEK